MAKELEQLLMDCREVVRASPNHDLPLGYRRAVWAELGTRYEEGPRASSDGLRRRVRLAEAAIRRVIPIWQETRGADDNMPQHVLESSEALMRGELSEEEALMQRGSLWTWLDDVAFEHEDQQVALAVGYGALQVLLCAVRDELFEPNVENLEITDGDVDPDELDASFMAAAAYSGGTVWDPLSDIGKRHSFWEWWLTEAVLDAANA